MVIDTGNRPPTRHGLRREWTAALIVGELLGFLAPAIAGAALAAVSVNDAILLLGLVAAGLVEGFTIGATQAFVLSRHIPDFAPRSWIVATVVSAGYAWFVGMGGALLLGSDVAPVPLLVGPMIPVWISALLSMGFLQWLVLRRYIEGSSRWIWVTALAWMTGVLIPIATMSVVPNAWPLAMFVVAGVLGATLMGAVVGVTTGSTLDTMLNR